MGAFATQGDYRMPAGYRLGRVPGPDLCFYRDSYVG
jgi:hypothetical protein